MSVCEACGRELPKLYFHNPSSGSFAVSQTPFLRDFFKDDAWMSMETKDGEPCRVVGASTRWITVLITVNIESDEFVLARINWEGQNVDDKGRVITDGIELVRKGVK